MNLLRPNKMAPGLLLACLVLAVAGCHKNQSQQTSETPNAQTQPAAQPASNPENAANPAAPATTSSPAASNAPAAPSAANPATAPESAPPPAAPAQATASPGPAVQQAQNEPQPAPVVVPGGTTLRIRINQHISVKTSHAGDPFDGTIVEPVAVKGTDVIPAGSLVQGRVVESKRRGRFKGQSVLELTLTSLDVNGRHYRLDTSTISRTKKGKGKRTAAFIGGGTGVGMLIGGVASGGVGLLIGGLSGAGAGTLGAAFTGNRDIEIPAETVMSFRLDQPIQLR